MTAKRLIVAKLKGCLSHAAVVLSILGIITFSLFIFEEAIQMATFGTWPAQYADDWEQVVRGADTIESINRGMKTLNSAVGWLQPLSFFSYRAYGKATDYYVESLRKKAFAAAPGCFVGKRVEFAFTPERIEQEGGRVRLIHGNVIVIADAYPKTPKTLVAGVVKKKDNCLVIEADSIRPVP